jgi:hypothetical protein
MAKGFLVATDIFDGALLMDSQKVTDRERDWVDQSGGAVEHGSTRSLGYFSAVLCER